MASPFLRHLFHRMFAIADSNILSAFLRCADVVLQDGVRKSDMSEVQDLMCKIALTDSDITSFQGFVKEVQDLPELHRGSKKAQIAYERVVGNITKPSYIGRLRQYPFVRSGSNDWSSIDQFKIIADQFEDAPQLSNLGMIVFHPLDISDAFRPGYVPCLSFVDIKFRGSRLSCKFYFRSCEFCEVAIFDFYHCINIQNIIASEFKKRRPDIAIIDREILFNFSRAFTYNRRRGGIFAIRSAADARRLHLS